MYPNKIHTEGREQMNKQMLKGLIIANDGNQSTLADAMGISLSRLNAKINETGAEFSQSEIAFIRDRYKLNKSQVVDIFFTSEVS